MERLRVLDEARKLKQLAQAFLYPERPVVATDPTACARNYFNRASVEVPEEDEEEERARIMDDARALKKQAVEYLHPELPVVTTDETACGRSYFGRASATEQESMEEAEERARHTLGAINWKTNILQYYCRLGYCREVELLQLYW